jgi:hypothetical protein
MDPKTKLSPSFRIQSPNKKNKFFYTVSSCTLTFQGENTLWTSSEKGYVSKSNALYNNCDLYYYWDGNLVIFKDDVFVWKAFEGPSAQSNYSLLLLDSGKVTSNDMIRNSTLWEL